MPSMTAISFFLIGIDEIGLQIEEPFGILPLERITGTIITNLDDMAAADNLVTVSRWQKRMERTAWLQLTGRPSIHLVRVADVTQSICLPVVLFGNAEWKPNCDSTASSSSSMPLTHSPPLSLSHSLSPLSLSPTPEPYPCSVSCRRSAMVMPVRALKALEGDRAPSSLMQLHGS